MGKLYEAIYGKNDRDYFFGHGDYTPIIEWCGDVKVRHDENDYQGDTIALLKKGNTYGILQFGWGSCSGCDALQACDTEEETEELARGMAASIEWQSLSSVYEDLKKWDTSGRWNPEFQEGFRREAMEWIERELGIEV